MRPALCILALPMLALVSCQSEPKTPPTQGQSALDVMERVAVGANNCWIKSGDPAFKAYSMAPELNSFSGKPRILLVRKGSSDIRPLLVVQAEGKPARLDAFGPMMSEPVAARIAADVRRWSGGAKGC
ncbi:MAG: hypothetical protein H5U11_11415 [Rhizobium sp.]|nr:hypothetical protein [Rhizobium sp.]